ncbi:MAG: tRNA (adenosine(37)-N6)-dimethylallyltransferase MiaA [Patescibacteria group bacterium]
MERRVIVILGPTASGKSALGVRLAKKFHGIVISADSRQVYKGMNIGTGKITAKEMRGVPHFLLDVASPRGQYSVARYVRDVRRVLKKIDSSTPVFLVGGSPFYIDALTKPDAYSPIPPDPKLRRRLAAKTTAQLIARLQALDSGRAKTIDPANRRRLIRAIEIASYQPPPLTRRGEEVVGVPPMRVLKIGITRPKTMLHRNIDRRVDTRLRQGMIAEVRRLHRHGLSWKRLDDFGLEYRYLSRYLRGQIAKTEAVRQLKSAIHDFAKRQMTWWKRDQDIGWVTKGQQTDKLVRTFLP